MLARDAVGTCGCEVFLDGNARSQDGEEGSENGSEIKDGQVSNDSQNDSSLTIKLTILSAASLQNFFWKSLGNFFGKL
jgi:hypothetical protein